MLANQVFNCLKSLPKRAGVLVKVATSTNEVRQMSTLASNAATTVDVRSVTQPKARLVSEVEKFRLYEPWTVCRLEDSNMIDQAKSLMYRVFVKEMGWKHAENTPTGFSIETLNNGKKILHDKLDSQAVWFGVVHEDKVIASMRRLNRDKFGHLDISRYPSSRKPSLASVLSPALNPRLTELQRIAIDSNYRGTTVLPWLFYYSFNDIYENNLNVIGSASSKKLGNFLTKYFSGPLCSLDNEFYYTENINGPASVFYVKRDAIPEILKTIVTMMKQGQRC
eukprot:gene14044-15503_t